MRAPLLVRPGEAGLHAALRSGADAFVVDLDGTGDREATRRNARTFMEDVRSRSGSPRLVLRVASLAFGLIDNDLEAAMAGAPDAVLLADAIGARDVQHLAAKLAVHEAVLGLADGRTRIVAEIGSARGLLAAPALPGASPRLSGLVWDEERFAADLGLLEVGAAARGADHRTAAPLVLGRGTAVAVARAAAVLAVDGPAPAGATDHAARCHAARRNGFAGTLVRDLAALAAAREAFGTSA